MLELVSEDGVNYIKLLRESILVSALLYIEFCMCNNFNIDRDIYFPLSHSAQILRSEGLQKTTKQWRNVSLLA